MDRKAIRTDDQRLERNLLIEYNRQKRAQGNQQLVLIYFYIFIFIFGFDVSDSIFESFKF
jgi:hypothetical protein